MVVYLNIPAIMDMWSFTLTSFIVFVTVFFIVSNFIIMEKDNRKSYIEHFDDVKPVADFIPGQAYCLSDLMKRFELGQRLNVRENFNPASEFCIEGQEDSFDEKFDNAAPENVTDIVDIQRLYQEHQEFKKSVAEKKKAKEGEEKDAIKKDDDKLTE